MTNPRIINPARCVTPRFTVRTPAACSSRHKEDADEKHERSPEVCSCLILAAMLLTPKTSAQQADEAKREWIKLTTTLDRTLNLEERFLRASRETLETYNTMVNLQEGPRLLNFTTEMRSLDHHGTFDRLYFSNFGYGGDPNVVSVLRISKNKWYSFDSMFRRDENFWNYSILANPFNPAPPPSNSPANFNPRRSILLSKCDTGTQVIAMSPHDYNTRRNMQNYNLIFFARRKNPISNGLQP